MASTHFYVEPSPMGGFDVRLLGADAPVSHHHTEEEAMRRRDAYARGAHSWVADGDLDAPAGEPVALGDGSTVLIRQVVAADKPLFSAGFARFGERSRYQRFLGVKKLLAERELEFLTGVDHHDHEAIGAVDAATGVGVGVGRFIRFQSGGEVAEAAVAIVDEWQGRGLGRILIDRLAHRAREEGVARLRASVLASNRAMIRLFQRVGPVRVIEREGETEELEIELRP